MSSLSFGKRGLFGAGLSALLFISAPGVSPAQAQPKSQAEQNATEGPGPNADAKAYVDFGAANGMRGDLEGAVKAFESAISLDPKFAPAYYNLGYAKSLQGKTDEALADYGKAIQLNPNYRDAYNQRGNLKGRHGDFAGAVPDFLEVVRIAPAYPQAHYNLGHVYYFTGDLDNALKELDTALSLDPKLSYAYFIRGLIRHAQGHSTDATADFRKSLGLDFPDAAFWIYLCENEDGLGDAAQKDLTDALAMPEAFKADDFPSAVGRFLLGNLPFDQLLAKATTAKAEDRGDFTCAAYFYAGMAEHLKHNTAGARDNFNKAIATDSKGSEEYVEAKRELATLPGL
jgi:tetratricopeptide (TPR) repeat protein